MSPLAILFVSMATAAVNSGGEVQNTNMSTADNISLKSAPQSLTSETKAKFDALLKAALKRKGVAGKNRKDINKSTQNLICSEGNSLEGISNLIEDETKAEIYEFRVEENKEFLMSKFLEGPGGEAEVYKPVPKPRKSKSKIIENDSNSSGGTYKITSPKIVAVHKSSSSSNSAATYVKSPKKETIGDILIHKSNIQQEFEKDKQYDNNCVVIIKQKKTSEEDDKIVIEEPKTSEERDISIQETKPKPKKRTKTTAHRQEENNDANQKQTEEKQMPENIMAITVHKTDRLDINSLISHPLVQIHIINSDTGLYLQKSDTNRSVVFYYENKDLNFISPVLTQAYDLKKHRSLIPAWEETVLFNEDFEHICKEENQVVIFFEVLDFLATSEVGRFQHKKARSAGWVRIAWAFLKLRSKNGCLNANRRVRLQLYKPHRASRENINKCEVYNWWKFGKFEKYPSSLHVTVKSLIKPAQETQVMRSKTPLAGEKGLEKSRRISESGDENFEQNFPKIQSAKIKTSYQLPEERYAELNAYDEGAFVLKFSHNGKFLAASVCIDGIYCVTLYEVDTLEEFGKIPVHQGVIYAISWSTNDNLLVTASADRTAVVSSIEKSSLLQMLPHPSFVYASEISSQNSVIATGCYDKTVRVWKSGSKDQSWELFQELEAHNSYVKSLCFSKMGDALYSGDAVGVILEWNCDGKSSWYLKREIKLAELRSIPINSILLNKKERKMLVHARDSLLRIVDLETMSVVHWLHGATNKSVQTMASYSPCGNYVTCGSETGKVNIWNCYTGKIIKTYVPYDENGGFFSVHGVQFHPCGNVIAFSHFGDDLPIRICIDNSLEEKCAGENSVKERSKRDVKYVGDCSDRVSFGDILCKIDEIISSEVS